MKLAFAGFRHSHIYSLCKKALAHPEITVTGCFEEVEAARAEALAAVPELDFCYPTYEALLADPSVEAVAIGDYYQKRGSMAIAALKSGKHVLCDKPLCTSLEELEEIEALTEQTGLQAGILLDLRYLPAADTARELLRGGTLGEILDISFTGQHCLNYGVRPQWYFEPGKHGGTLNDIAIHGVDLVRYLTGLELTEVTCARTWNAFAAEVPSFRDSGHLMCRMGRAALLADVSYAAPRFAGTLPTYWEFRFWGTKGLLTFRLAEDCIHLYTAEETVIPCTAPQRDCLDDFLAEIGGASTRMNTRDLLRSTRQTLLLQAAADRA